MPADCSCSARMEFVFITFCCLRRLCAWMCAGVYARATHSQQLPPRFLRIDANMTCCPRTCIMGSSVCKHMTALLHRRRRAVGVCALALLAAAASLAVVARAYIHTYIHIYNVYTYTHTCAHTCAHASRCITVTRGVCRATRRRALVIERAHAQTRQQLPHLRRVLLRFHGRRRRARRCSCSEEWEGEEVNEEEYGTCRKHTAHARALPAISPLLR